VYCKHDGYSAAVASIRPPSCRRPCWPQLPYQAGQNKTRINRLHMPAHDFSAVRARSSQSDRDAAPAMRQKSAQPPLVYDVSRLCAHCACTRISSGNLYSCTPGIRFDRLTFAFATRNNASCRAEWWRRVTGDHTDITTTLTNE
jgi:hypothetical protein